MRGDSNAAAYVPRGPKLLGQRIRVPQGAMVADFKLAPKDGEPRAVTAAAQVLSSKTVGREVKRPGTAEWQRDAWALRDEIGEFRFIGDRQARACSQVRLFIGRKTTPDSEPDIVTEGRPAELSKALFSNQIAVEQALRRGAQHVIYNGESILLVTENGTSLDWSAHSVSELSGGKGKWKLNDGLNPRDIDADTEVVVRAWNPHPEKGALADAPSRAVLPAARELRGLTQFVGAQIDSRLAGAGLLILPQGIVSTHALATGDASVSFADELTDYFITPIKDRESAAAVVPFMATVPPDLVDKIQHITFDSQLDAQAPQLRDEAIRRIGLGMDSDPSVLLGQASSNHWCVDDQTEIYTQDRGWVRESALAVGDIVMTLNHDTGMSEWQPVLDIYRADVADEPMRYMETQRHNSLTTANHRWPVLVPTYENGRKAGFRTDWTTSDEMVSKHTVITGAPHAGLPTEPKWQDDVVEAVAWYWTEGNLNSGGYGGATIAQSHTVNPARADRIRGCLTRLFGPAGEGWSEYAQANETSHGGPITVFRLRKDAATVITEHAPGRDKIVPTEFVESLTLAQLELFIDISCQGDGWHYRHGKIDIWQKNPAALAAFERALILSGRAVSTHASGDGVAVSALKSNRQRPAKGRNGDRDRVIEQYTGVVWCPTTSNSTWFARRNGQSFFTGNSAWAVDENEVKYGVIPVVSTICHALTVGLLHPLLEAEGIADATEYVVWYDATPLQVRADKSKDAQSLFDKDAIGAVALRRETGFDDADKPTDQELEARKLWQLLQMRPDWADKILPRLGIYLDDVGGAPESAEEAQVDDESQTTMPLDSPTGEAPPPENSPPTMEPPA